MPTMLSESSRSFLTWFTVCGAVLCLVADAGGAPRVVFSETETDLGCSLYYKETEHPFKFKNEGDAPLQVKVIKSSCGCTAGLVTENEVVPGGEGVCSIQFKPKEKKRLGQQSFTVLVSTNDPNKKEELLTMKVRLVESVDAQPERLSFGTIGASAGPAKLSLALDCYKDEGAPQILSVKGQVPQVTVKPSGEEETDKAVRHTFDIILDPKGLGHDFRSSILVKTNVPRLPLLEIPVEATLEYPVKAQPQIVLFGVVQKGKVSRKEVMLTVPESVGPPAQAVSADPLIKGSLEAGKAAGQWRLIVECAADNKTPGPSKIKTDIQIMDKSGAILVVVPARGVIQSQPPAVQ